MTGYLHIPVGAELRASIAEAAHEWEWPGCDHESSLLPDCERLADSLLIVLCGLSVEPTEHPPAVQRCLDFSKALMGVMPELDDPAAAELVTHRALQWEREADRLNALAAPVPVQEDQP